MCRTFPGILAAKKEKKRRKKGNVELCVKMLVLLLPCFDGSGGKSNLTTENCSHEGHFCIELRELKSTKSAFFLYIKRAHP